MSADQAVQLHRAGHGGAVDGEQRVTGLQHCCGRRAGFDVANSELQRARLDPEVEQGCRLRIQLRLAHLIRVLLLDLLAALVRGADRLLRLHGFV